MIELRTLQDALISLSAAMTGYLPRLLTALLILLLGWFLARVLAWLGQRLADRLQLNRLLERTGVAAGLEKAEIRHSGTEILALLLFWIIFLNFILIAMEILGLASAVAPLRTLIAFLPRLLGALVTLVIGVLLAQFLGRAVQATMSSIGIEFYEQGGQAVTLMLLIMVVILVLEQLGIDATIMTSVFSNVITIIVAGMALAFALGGRDVARNVLAGYYAREQFALGDTLEINGDRGTLEAIGTLNAEIRLADELLIIPNARLTESVVKVRETAGGSERPAA